MADRAELIAEIRRMIVEVVGRRVENELVEADDAELEAYRDQLKADLDESRRTNEEADMLAKAAGKAKLYKAQD